MNRRPEPPVRYAPIKGVPEDLEHVEIPDHFERRNDDRAETVLPRQSVRVNLGPIVNRACDFNAAEYESTADLAAEVAAMGLALKIRYPEGQRTAAEGFLRVMQDNHGIEPAADWIFFEVMLGGKVQVVVWE